MAALDANERGDFPLGVRVAVGFMSYADETYVALISTRSVVPRIERLATLVQRSFRERPETVVSGVG